MCCWAETKVMNYLLYLPEEREGHGIFVIQVIFVIQRSSAVMPARTCFKSPLSQSCITLINYLTSLILTLNFIIWKMKIIIAPLTRYGEFRNHKQINMPTWCLAHNCQHLRSTFYYYSLHNNWAILSFAYRERSFFNCCYCYLCTGSLLKPPLIIVVIFPCSQERTPWLKK